MRVWEDPRLCMVPNKCVETTIWVRATVRASIRQRRGPVDDFHHSDIGSAHIYHICFTALPNRDN